MGYSGSWVFSLMINNKSDEELIVQRSDLSWGHWFLGQQDGKEPINIPANSSRPVEAFALRASSGTATGYQGSCTWSSKYGNLTLQVEVPYSASNKVSMKSTGGLIVTGWTEVGKRGHQFTRSIEIAAAPGARPAPANDITNWRYIETLEQMNAYHYDKHLPTEDTSEMAKIIGRSAAVAIEQAYWPGIIDPIYKNFNIQKEKISEYFAVAVYSRTTTADARVDIAAKDEVVQTKKVEFSTIYKHTVENSIAVEASIKGSYAPEKNKGGVSLEASLSSKFNHRNITEKSQSTCVSESETLTRKSMDKSRSLVQWTFWTTIAIYRKLNDGAYSLVSVSEWPDATKYVAFMRDN